jgi:hypothetical protein
MRISTRLRALLLAAGAAIGFYALGLSDAVYDVTSPGSGLVHVLVRKLYSLACFGLLGYLASRLVTRAPAPVSSVRAAVIIALYSAAVELGQHLTGGRESLKWNAIDTALGFIGGGLGGALASGNPRWISAADEGEDSRDERRARVDVDLG